MRARAHEGIAFCLHLVVSFLSLWAGGDGGVRVVCSSHSRSLAQGNAFFKRKEYARAIECYTSALTGMPNEAAIYSNRSVCFMREREYERALADAEMCIKLNPEWSKGWYRYGHTLMFMEKCVRMRCGDPAHQAIRYEESVDYFKKANMLEPNNEEIRRCLREAEGLEHNQRATLANTMGAPLPVQPLRRPRIAGPRFHPDMLHKKLSLEDDWFKDSMTCKSNPRIFVVALCVLNPCWQC